MADECDTDECEFCNTVRASPEYREALNKALDGLVWDDENDFWVDEEGEDG